jgi:hypothetical protein
MAPLAEIGKGELTFEVSGTTISLRALTPEEEIQVQRFARSVLAEGDLTDQANALEYLDRFRNGSLGYSIVQVGDLDFRNVEFIETGEKLPNGTAIKVHRHEAIQQLVGTWSRNMTVAVFKKFGELMNQVEKEVDGLVEFEPVDYDAEITRLEERISELKEEKARLNGSEDDPRTNLRKQVATSGKSFRRPHQGSAVPVDLTKDQTNTVQEAETVSVPSAVDREIIFDDGEAQFKEREVKEPVQEPLPPVEVPAEKSVPSGPRKAVFARENVKVPPPTPAAVEAATKQVVPDDFVKLAESHPEGEPLPPLSDVMSSMVDMTDPEAAEKAVEVETRRIMEMRANAARVGRPPPHMAAKQVAQEIERPVAAGLKDGVEVYKMPTETLTDRKSPESTSSPAPVRSNVNPRFKPTRSGG